MCTQLPACAAAYMRLVQSMAALRPGWQELFTRTLVFTGPEIVAEFLMSTGCLAGAHSEDCPVYGVILGLEPPWRRTAGSGFP